MPWTLAHPAVVVPLRRVKLFDFAALVIGSMTPDLGYYIRSEISAPAHAFHGSLIYDLLPGLLLYAAFLLMRKPICFILPTPHREALLRLCETMRAFSFRDLPSICISLLLGAWTHILWDRFTHEAGWYVMTTPRLFPVAVAAASARLSSYVVLEILGSAIGAMILLALYCRWLVRQNVGTRASGSSETWRYFVCASVAVASLAGAFALTAHEQPLALRYHLPELFISTFAIDLLTVAAPLLVFVSSAVYFGQWLSCRHRAPFAVEK